MTILPKTSSPQNCNKSFWTNGNFFSTGKLNMQNNVKIDEYSEKIH